VTVEENVFKRSSKGLHLFVTHFRLRVYQFWNILFQKIWIVY